MIGFIIAAECALALVFLWMFRRHRAHGFGMYRMFQKLGTTPGQEQVIRTALTQVRQAGRKARDDAKAARPELADLVRAESFDEESAKSWLSSRERALSDLKPSLLHSLREIHEVLDPEQRTKLASWLESSPPYFFGRHRGCGRHHRRYAL